LDGAALIQLLDKLPAYLGSKALAQNP
jgi:hypothetical protein